MKNKTNKRPRVAELTDREAAVLAYITDYKQQHGYAPSIREISAKLEFNSTSLAWFYLDGLELKGKIRRTPGIARAITVLE